MEKPWNYTTQFKETKVKYIKNKEIIFDNQTYLLILLQLKQTNQFFTMKKRIFLSFGLALFLSIGCSKSDKQPVVAPKNNVTVIEKVNQKTETPTTQSVVEEKKAIVVEKATSTAKTEPIKKEEPTAEVAALRKRHEEFLKNSPFKKSLQLTKQERKANGIPPKKYYEHEWELSLSPVDGKTHPENVFGTIENLKRQRALDFAEGRVPGDASNNNWVERGPDNVGGRVRAVMFDPNDATTETVFAGGVSGGLWKNTNISSALSTWTRVNIPENLSVSSIDYDPNNTNIFYVGTGESYVGGDVNGDGLWKSTDGGATFSRVFGGISGPTSFVSAANVTVNSPSSIAGQLPCYPTNPANFGSAITAPVTSNIVLVQDNTPPASDGCETITNGAALSGKIALIRRGLCPFVTKVKAAETAGAIAVIMMNNTPGTPVPMGGTDATILIPSVMISQADGDALEAALTSGAVNVTLNPTTGTITGNIVPGQQHINDVRVRNNNGVSEVWVAAGDSYYGAANATTFLGGPGFGLYKSTNGGTSWTEVSMPLTANNNKHCPNDIEIGADNKIWIATTRSTVFGDGGGKIFSSSDGTTFTLKHTITDGQRTQIVASKSNADKLYVLGELGVDAIESTILKTTNGFTTVSTMPIPVDAETSARFTTYGFTGQQAFFNLLIAIDPSNDDTLYVGGIDLFKSTNGASAWTQISHWYAGFGFQYVHSDQHGLAFAPGNNSKLLFGNDGGTYFSSNGGGTIAARNRGLNITQFYSAGVAPTGATGGNLSGEFFAAGAQDNGTQYFGGVGAGVNGSTQSQGGDGAFTMFDQGADKYYVSNYVYNGSINLRPIPSGTTRVINSESASNGAFIAPMVLDSSLDILYSDYSTTAPVNQIARYRNIKSGTVVRTLLTNALLTAPPTAFAVSPYTTASTTLLVGTRLGRLLRVTTANSIAQWTEISSNQFVGSISDVEYGASNNEIFVTMHNYNVVSIWYTKDGGVTWTNKEGNFPDIPVKAILANPLKNVGGFATEVIIGTELGVWYCNNFDSANPTWNQAYNGMSNVKVTDLDLRNDNTVFAATYGRGIFSGTFTADTLSTKDETLAKGVKVYPNPSNGIFNIAVANYSGTMNISVYDINGRQIQSNSADFSGEKTINLQGLQAGVYIVKLEGNGLSHSEKIVIK